MSFHSQYGLIGYPLDHSFSRHYFSEKFRREGISNSNYALFPLKEVSDIRSLLARYANLRGLNVTIPYKEAVIPFLDELDPDAREIGAVNVIAFQNGRTVGYNTDVLGFEQAFSGLDPAWQHHASMQHALVLGTGGAAKAVCWVFEKKGIPVQLVSRTQQPGRINYQMLRKYDWEAVRWIINTTPLGTYPDTHIAPDLPFESLNRQHFVMDLIYNPAETLLLQKAKSMGCPIKNGLEMLEVQAEKAWEIWQSS